MQGAHPGQQLVDLERLDQVVLGARVQPGHPVGDRAERGEHQHRHGDRLPAQPPHQVDPVEGGQAAVDDEHVVRAGQPEVQPALALQGVIDGVTLFGEQADQHVPQFAVVLDEQQPARDRTGRA